MAKVLIVLLLVTIFQPDRESAFPVDESFQQISNRASEFYSPECKSWIASQLWPDSVTLGSTSPADIINQLPSVSIVITFYNEPVDLLENTVQFIWQRTPHILVKEILLVDDASDIPFDLLWLSEYKEKVHLIRNVNRAGLMVSRMNGARRAGASVLVFLDSHVEVDPGWLPALLARLVHARMENRSITRPSNSKCRQTEISEKIVVSPAVYDVTASEEAYGATRHPSVHTGGFTWNLTFRWETEDSRDDWVKPQKTPVISGGLFAVWKDVFFNMGGYDEEMRIWGGENVEFSLRTWMCGGQMEIIPCSRIGHLFRKAHPYSFPQGKEVTIIRNNKRAALVWFLNRPATVETTQDSLQPDDFLAMFYTTCPLARIVPAGSVKPRRELFKQLGCHSFSWYLHCVYPKLRQEANEMVVEDAVKSLAELEVNSQKGQ